MLRSCPSHSVQPITEPASIKIVVEFTLLNVLNSLHSYTQTQKLYRGKMTGITSFSAGFEGTVIWLIWFLCSVLTRENMKICEIDLNHFHECVSVDICCLTCWLTHRLTRASTKSTGNVCFWMDHGDERWQEYSFMAWHEIIICFLYTCTCWFYFLMLFKKKKKRFVSDITIILTSNDSYDYLLKLLQMNVLVSECLWMNQLQGC